MYIIDWLMPDMNGIETVRRIRMVVGEEYPIIILTAYDWSDVEQGGKRGGSNCICVETVVSFRAAGSSDESGAKRTP